MRPDGAGTCALWLGLVLLLLSTNALGQANPWLSWRTLSSEHFRIHFPAEAEDKARHALAIAEEVHERLAPAIGWQPRARTEIVLTDPVDFANGFASPLPYNHIYLFASPPDGLTTLADYDDWLELLITHEYTHTLHLDKARGFPRGARWALGRNPLLFPALFQPTWMIEGLAIHEETDDKRGIGRGQSALFDMQMRMEVASGIKPFDQVSMSGITEWPVGNTPYLYGAYFFRYVEDRYGEDKVRELIDNYSNNVIPFLLNRNFRQTLGIDGGELWADFANWLRERFEPELAAIRNDGVRAGERLTTDGYRTAQASASGREEVYYVRAEAERNPALMRWSAGRGHHEVTRLNGSARINADPVHGVLVAQPETCRNRQVYYDLYRIDPRGGAVERLTHCERYRDAVWTASGEHIIATRIELGRARIDRLAANGDFIETLWQGERGEVPGRMDVAPDDQRLVAALKRPGRGWALEELDLEDGTWHPLTDDATLEGDPAYTPDGDGVLYTSAHGGVFNLRRLDRASGEVTTLSNVEGGAFSPTQGHPDGPIFYIGYSGDGHDLFRLARPLAEPGLPPGREWPVGTIAAANDGDADSVPATAAADDDVADGPPRRYSPLLTLLPRSWTPVIAVTDAVTEAGINVAAHDVLRKHSYSLTVGREFNEGLDWGGISYTFANRLNLLALRTYDYDTRDVEDSDDDREIERATANDVLQARLSFPWLRQRWRAAAHVGAGITRERDRFVADGVEPDPDETSGVAGLGLTFDNTDRHLRSVSRRGGRQIRLIGESNEAFNSDYTGEVYTLDWRELITLHRQHVLALRAVQGWGTEQPREFRLGSARASDLIGPGPMFDRRRYALRGYPDDFQGRRLRLLSAEYRFPIWRLERSFTRVPLGLQQLSGRAIYEGGATWDEGSSPDTLRRSVGLEFVADVNLLYLSNVRVRSGIARGLDEGRETETYVLLETAF